MASENSLLDISISKVVLKSKLRIKPKVNLESKPGGLFRVYSDVRLGLICTVPLIGVYSLGSLWVYFGFVKG